LDKEQFFYGGRGPIMPVNVHGSSPIMLVNVHGSNACKRALNVKKIVLDWLTLMIDSNVFAFE
jgi:hypothetical protein